MSFHMELHPLCTLFPRMSSSEFMTLRDDIAANGLLTPITTYEGLILDGGNRYRACIEAGVEPRYEEYVGDDIVQFVLSSNLNRRHLMPGQMAIVVAQAQDWSKAHGRGGNGSNQHVREQTGNVAGLLGDSDTVASRQILSGASERTQRNADKVARMNPDLAAKVVHGEISLPKALKQLTPEKPEPEEPIVGDAMRLYEDGAYFSAFVLAQQAKKAIRQISKKDPNAMSGVESIQVALNTCREVVQSWVRENEN